jgi:hypothetical protein
LPDVPSPPPSPARNSRLLEQVRAAIRTRHYSLRTEEAYVGWITRFILFHGKRHPNEMGEPEINRFLSDLAVRKKVAASTQTQALSALLFLYRHVLGQTLPRLGDVVRASRPAKLPTVLKPSRFGEGPPREGPARRLRRGLSPRRARAEVPGRRAPLGMAIRLPRPFPEPRSPVGKNETASPGRVRRAESGSPGRPRCEADQAGELPHLAALFCHTSPGGRLRHPDHPGAVGTPGCGDHDDLHSRSEPSWRPRSPEPPRLDPQRIRVKTMKAIGRGQGKGDRLERNSCRQVRLSRRVIDRQSVRLSDPQPPSSPRHIMVPVRHLNAVMRATPRAHRRTSHPSISCDPSPPTSC